MKISLPRGVLTPSHPPRTHEKKEKPLLTTTPARAILTVLPALVCSLSLNAQTQLALLPKPEADVPPPQRGVHAAKELLILDPAVVDSARANYPGAFSIGHLFDQLAGEAGDGRVLMREWLRSWEVPQVVNHSTVAARPNIYEKLIQPWQEADGYQASSGKQWLPDFNNAPFRLLGIVNRLDLMNLTTAYYGSGSLNAAPEGRLVYAALDADGNPLGHHFTLIVEYSMVAGSRPATNELRDLSRRWHALGEHEDFDEDYLIALEDLTRAFTDVRKDKDGEFQPPRLGQIRTNEMALTKSCEMREFKMAKQTGKKTPLLELAPVARTPRMEFTQRGTAEHRALSAWVMNRSSSGTLPSMPDKISNGRGKMIPLLGGSCTVPDTQFHWETGGVGTRDIRTVFSRGTCNGCHAGETQTRFCHIRPRDAGKASEISDFLAMSYHGQTVKDKGQAFETVTTTEMRNRVQDLLKQVHPGIGAGDLETLVRRSFPDGYDPPKQKKRRGLAAR